MSDVQPEGTEPPFEAAPDPVAPGPAAAAPVGLSQAGKTRNPWGVFLLSFITLGIYGLWWYYTINDEVRKYDRRIEVDPTMSLLALLFGWVTCGIVTFVSVYRTGERIAQAQEAAGASERCQPVIGLLLSFIGFQGVYLQSQLNKVWDAYGNPEPQTAL